LKEIVGGDRKKGESPSETRPPRERPEDPELDPDPIEDNDLEVSSELLRLDLVDHDSDLNDQLLFDEQDAEEVKQSHSINQ